MTELVTTAIYCTYCGREFTAYFNSTPGSDQTCPDCKEAVSTYVPPPQTIAESSGWRARGGGIPEWQNPLNVITPTPPANEQGEGDWNRHRNNLNDNRGIPTLARFISPNAVQPVLDEPVVPEFDHEILETLLAEFGEAIEGMARAGTEAHAQANRVHDPTAARGTLTVTNPSWRTTPRPEPTHQDPTFTDQDRGIAFNYIENVMNDDIYQIHGSINILEFVRHQLLTRFLAFGNVTIEVEDAADNNAWTGIARAVQNRMLRIRKRIHAQLLIHGNATVVIERRNAHETQAARHAIIDVVNQGTENRHTETEPGVPIREQTEAEVMAYVEQVVRTTLNNPGPIGTMTREAIARGVIEREQTVRTAMNALDALNPTPAQTVTESINRLADRLQTEHNANPENRNPPTPEQAAEYQTLHDEFIERITRDIEVHTAEVLAARARPTIIMTIGSPPMPQPTELHTGGPNNRQRLHLAVDPADPSAATAFVVSREDDILTVHDVIRVIHPRNAGAANWGRRRYTANVELAFNSGFDRLSQIFGTTTNEFITDDPVPTKVAARRQARADRKAKRNAKKNNANPLLQRKKRKQAKKLRRY